MTEKDQRIEQTFAQEQGKLKSFVKSKVGSTEDAEDIVQDVFATLVGGFDDILDLRKTIGWLYAVAKNKIIDLQRKKKTISLEEELEHAENAYDLNLKDLLPSKEALPDEQMMLELVWEEIDLRLEELPKEQREVFELHELEGYSFQQISDITGVGINTLVSRKRYAVVYLRQYLRSLFEIIKE